MRRITFLVPGKPTSKGRGRSIPGTNRVATPKATVQKEKEVAGLARIAMRGQNPLTGPVKLHVVFVFEIPTGWSRKSRQAALEGRVWHVGPTDVDNMAKLISDACNEIIWADDGQVAIVTTGKRYGHPERAEVVIEELPQLEDAKTPGQRLLEKRMASGEWHRAKAEKAARKGLRR